MNNKNNLFRIRREINNESVSIQYSIRKWIINPTDFGFIPKRSNSVKRNEFFFALDTSLNWPETRRLYFRCRRSTSSTVVLTLVTSSPCRNSWFCLSALQTSPKPWKWAARCITTWRPVSRRSLASTLPPSVTRVALRRISSKTRKLSILSSMLLRYSSHESTSFRRDTTILILL